MSFEGGEGFDAEKLARFSIVTRMIHNREVEVYKQLNKFNHPDIPYAKVGILQSFRVTCRPNSRLFLNRRNTVDE